MNLSDTTKKTKCYIPQKKIKFQSGIVQGSGSIVRSSIVASRATDPGSNPGRSTFQVQILSPPVFMSFDRESASVNNFYKRIHRKTLGRCCRHGEDEVVLVARSHIRSSGNIHSGSSPGQQALPAGLLRALQLHASQHRNLLDSRRRLLLVWQEESRTPSLNPSFSSCEREERVLQPSLSQDLEASLGRSRRRKRSSSLDP